LTLDGVAKVVLKVVTSENPDLRYLAGNDIETVIEAKRNMSDEEFYKMVACLSSSSLSSAIFLECTAILNFNRVDF